MANNVRGSARQVASSYKFQNFAIGNCEVSYVDLHLMTKTEGIR